MLLSVANLILHEHLEGEFATHVAFPNAKLEKIKMCFQRATMKFWPNSSTKTPTTVVERLGHCSIKELSCSHNSGNRTRFFLIKHARSGLHRIRSFAFENVLSCMPYKSWLTETENSFVEPEPKYYAEVISHPNHYLRI